MERWVKAILLIFIAIVICGCIKARDYFTAKNNAVSMNVVVPLGSGERSRKYIVLGNKVIDKGDTHAIVKHKLGQPSYIGTTIEGYSFYRYNRYMAEIYFDNNRVIDWTRIEFKP